MLVSFARKNSEIYNELYTTNAKEIFGQSAEYRYAEGESDLHLYSDVATDIA